MRWLVLACLWPLRCFQSEVVDAIRVVLMGTMMGTMRICAIPGRLELRI
jgi:hypothetical protein